MWSGNKTNKRSSFTGASRAPRFIFETYPNIGSFTPEDKTRLQNTYNRQQAATGIESHGETVPKDNFLEKVKSNTDNPVQKIE